MAHRCHDLTTKGQISPQPNGTPVWNVAIFGFFSCYIQRFRLRSICYGWNVRLGKSLLSNGVLHWHIAIRRSESTNIISHKYVHSGCVKTVQNGSDSGQMPLQSWALYWHTAIKRHTRCMFVSDICKGHQHIYFKRETQIYIYIYYRTDNPTC